MQSASFVRLSAKPEMCVRYVVVCTWQDQENCPPSMIEVRPTALTFDLVLQSQASYGHDSHTKKSSSKVGWFKKIKKLNYSATSCLYCRQLRPVNSGKNLITNNNNRDDTYGAVIMAKPLWKFTRFIWWMQTQRRSGRQPSDQTNRLGLQVRQKEMALITNY